MLAGDVAFSAWTDPLDAADVNGDGEVTALDALVVINGLNRADTSILKTHVPPILGGEGMHYDVNGDGEVSAIDSLRVINRLNQGILVQSEDAVWTEGELSETSVAAIDLVFRNDFARSRSVLSPAGPIDRFRFTADQDFAAVDVNSLADESHVKVRVLDEFGVEIAVASEMGDRKDFEGFKFSTHAGHQYQIEVELTSGRAESFGYSIDVLQFDLQDWPSVQVSNLPGFGWMNTIGTEMQIGNDAHADVSGDASLVRTFDQQAKVHASIDMPGDLDWFRVPSISNAVAVSIIGRDSFPVRFDVYDAEMNSLQPMTTLSNAGDISSATYLVDRPGEVFIRVAGVNSQVGRYDLQVRDSGATPPTTGSMGSLELDDQVGNQPADAAELHFRGEVLSFDQRLETSDDVDVFRVPTTAVKNVFVSGVAGIRFELLDSDGKIIDRADPIFQSDGALDIASYTLPVDEHANAESFVRVWSERGAVGRYQLTIAIGQELPQTEIDSPFDIFASSDSPDSELGNDRHSDELLSATRFTTITAETIVSNLDSPDDLDTFYVAGISNVATFSVHTHDPMGIEITLLDRGGNVLEPLTSIVSGNSVGVSFSMPTLKEYVDEQGNPKRRLFVQISSSDGSTGEYKLIRGYTPIPMVPDEIMGIDEHHGSVSEATPIVNSPISHEVYSNLDGWNDRDAFEFTASTAEASLTVVRSEQLGVQGIGTVDLFTTDGVLVEPTRVVEAPFESFVSRFIKKSYELTAGEKYVAVVSNEETSVQGSYRLQIDALGDVLGAFDLSAADTVLIPDLESVAEPTNIFGAGVDWVTAPLNIQLDGVDDVQFFRFTSSDLYVLVNTPTGSPANITDVSLRLRLFNLTDGESLGDPARWHDQNHLAEQLPSAIDNATRDYVLAVWSPKGEGTFEMDLQIGRRVVSQTDDVADTFTDAQPLDLQNGDMVLPSTGTQDPSEGLYTRFATDFHDTEDVDVYRIEAANPITRAGVMWGGMEAFDPETQPEAVNRIVLELYDEDGNAVAKHAAGAILLSQWTFESVDFETEVGKTYFLRISQTTPNPIRGRFFIA
ncbi:dockerin type I domain-containing protein [Rhodopirellula bahusiensis]|uniref:dockerin type I domain-containing protein n=1 Tax=Rhodopirellula bahusiensis TaxID=2014065 RepID=UPI003297B7B9